MKKTLAVILACVLAIGLFAGCTAAEKGGAPAATEAPKAEPAKALKVAVLTGSLTNTPFCVAMGDAIKGKMESQGWELSIFDADMDATKQSTQFETALMTEPDVIVYWCRDSVAAVEDVKKADEAGIPVISLNNDVAKEGWEYVLCFVGPNQYQIGYDLGTYMTEHLASANIAIVDGLANNTTYNARYSGFSDAIKDKSAYKVLVHDYCNADRTTAQTMTENYITGFADLDTVVCFSDNFAIGALNAIKAAGKKINVFSIDGMQIGFDAVKDGSITATVLQTPGYQIEKVVQIINDVIVGGGTVSEHNQFSGHYVIDKSNMDQYKPEY